MTDELNTQGLETQPEPQDDQQTQPEPVDVNQLNSTWQGRLQKEQQIKDNLTAQLRAAGYNVDEQGNIITAQQAPSYAPAYTPTQTAPQNPAAGYIDPNNFDPYDMEQVQALIRQEASVLTQQALGAIIPQIENLSQSAAAQQYSDWAEIQPIIETKARQHGFHSVAHMQAVNPAFFQDMVVVARASKPAVQQQTGPTPQQIAEQQRQAALNAVSGVGGSTTTGAAVSYNLTPDEKAQAASMGMSDEQVSQLMSGPAKIQRKAGK